MKREDKKTIEQMLSSFESAIEEFEKADPLQNDEIISRLSNMDAALSAFEIIEA